MTDPGAVKRALRPSTRLIWIETPSNPRLHVTDIVAMVALAKTIGARTVVDNTWATPVLQRPLELGVDFVMHSTTKYLGGHSDVLGGAVVARSMDSVFERIRTIQTTLGAVPSPFDCWLILRGLRSLPYRMRGHVEGAQKVAAYLAAHPAVDACLLSGPVVRSRLRGGEPADAAARRRCCRSTSTAGASEAFALVNALRLVTRATSLGGPETLIEHRASVEGEHTRAPESLLRVSIGLEHPDDLIEDFAAGARGADDRRRCPSRHRGIAASAVVSSPVALLAGVAAAEPLRLHPKNPHYFLFRGKPAVLVTSGEHYGAVAEPRLQVRRLSRHARRRRPEPDAPVRRQLPRKIRRLRHPLQHARAGARPRDHAVGAQRRRRLRRRRAEVRPRSVGPRLLRAPQGLRRQGRRPRHRRRGRAVLELVRQGHHEPAAPVEQRQRPRRDRIPTTRTRWPMARLLARQEAMVRKVVAELNAFDNVYFEIQNEPDATSARHARDSGVARCRMRPGA